MEENKTEEKKIEEQAEETSETKPAENNPNENKPEEVKKEETPKEEKQKKEKKPKDNKIGDYIKEVRTKNKLSQERFGDRYGVTSKDVNKWELGKDLPNMFILTKICNENNKDINELVNDETYKIVKKRKIIKGVIVYALILIAILSAILIPKLIINPKFEYKKGKDKCDTFQLTGNMAFNKKQTAILISDITYCGKNDENEYKEIEVNFYEKDGPIKKKIDTYVYDRKSITIEKFLKHVKFEIDNKSSACTINKKSTLTLEIKATKDSKNMKFYEIPVKLKGKCKKLESDKN